MDEHITQDGFPTLEDVQGEPKAIQETLFSLEELTVLTVGNVDRIKQELKTARDMYDECFTNDASYKEEAEKVKEQSQHLKTLKATIQRQPSVQSLAETVKTLKNELKEKQSSISDYALEVYRLTGINEFDKDGQTYDIKTVAKVVKRKQ